MRWRQGRRSANVEDRRGRARRAAPKFGIGAIAVVLIGIYLGADPQQMLQLVTGGGGGAALSGGSAPPISAEQEELADFVSVVLADTEDTWHALFQKMGGTYKEPNLVLFSDAVQSACGRAGASTGPFYCPADSKVYIDLSFYRDLRERHSAPGDFAQAYVIAHEIGHHVQNLLGTSRKVQSMRGRISQEEYNALSVRLELQADFYAGLWAHHANRSRHILEAGDVEEALGAASAIGDDRLQREARGYITPESFTHGTSEQRVRWFRRGLESGDFKQGDTFAEKQL